jgi:amidophosphoribosyltransferase
MAVAHNGNLSNAAKLRSALELTGAIFHTSSDTEIIAYIVTKERLGAPSIEEALSRAMDTLEGAYSLVLMSPQKLICARDPYGFRPLCYGRTADGVYVVASESCALHAVGAEFIRDVEPGEILVFSRDGIVFRKEHCGKKQRKLCVFEYIYFARPDSVMDGISVQEARIRAGMELARVHPVDADVVIGVPDSGLDAAIGYAHASGIPYAIGLTKNKYVGRTFIAPTQGERETGVRLKLNPVRSIVEGRKIVLIDDSIVRGTTSAYIIRLLKEAGATAVHMRISAPPFLHPCYYGTDVDSANSLIANGHTPEEIAGMIGADSLGFLTVERALCLAGDDASGAFCAACFNGVYPDGTPVVTDKERFE